MEADRKSAPSLPQRRWQKYACGAALMYGVCVFWTGPWFSNQFSTIVESGLFIGSFVFLIFGPVHFLFQLTAFGILVRLRKSHDRHNGYLINLPACLTLISLLVSSAIPMSPTALHNAVQSHFGHPLPSSVNVKGYRMQRGLDWGMFEFVISGNPGDLDQILTNAGWAVASSNDFGFGTAAMSNAQQRARDLSSGVVELKPPLLSYHFEQEHGISRTYKSMTLSSNRADGVLTVGFY